MPLGLNWKKSISSTSKTPNNEEPVSIIGLDMVGHGIRLKPYQAYELKEILFEGQAGQRIFQALETGKSYWIPNGYEVSETPPLPTNQAIDGIVVEESREHFESRLNVDAQVATSHHVFSLDVQTGQLKLLRPEEESFYAAKTFFVPFWALYLPDVTGFSEKKFKLNIPTPFQYKNKRAYDQFFERYGTHYIKRAWIGGKALLAFTVAKSTGMTKANIRKSLHACYALASGSTDVNLKEAVAKLHDNSECVVLAQGGDAAKLGALNLLDEARYNEWLASVKENPKVVEFEAVGIWSLINDEEKRKALWEAYQTATIFTPFSTAFSDDRQKVHFIRGKECICYNSITRESSESKPIQEEWPCLTEVRGFETIDAIFRGTHVKSCEGQKLMNKLFFFKGNQCIRVDMETKEIDEGYPKSIAEEWSGVSFDKIDAILSSDSESLYFFFKDQYIRYNLITNQVDPGYPKPIVAKWAGVTFDRIDAVVVWKDVSAYFFRGNEYIRYDMVKYRSKGGYPKFLVGNYIEDWNLFD